MAGPAGLLLIDKPSGPTSHDVVAHVRRALRTKRVGHAGTLDPAATGLLILGVGVGTKLLRFVEARAKTYRATVRLGRSTTTEDGEGETVEERAVDAGPGWEDRVRAAATGLVGRLEQTVPAYSAVKVGGERLYKKARRGEAGARPVRSVEIHRLEILEVKDAEVCIEAEVSKGTYIRTLGVQLGAALDLPAHVPALRRTGVGPWSVEEARPLDDFDEEDLQPLTGALADRVDVDDRVAQRVVRGQAVLAPDSAPEGPFGLFHERWGLLGVAERVGAGEPLRYLCVLQTPDQVSS